MTEWYYCEKKDFYPFFPTIGPDGGNIQIPLWRKSLANFFKFGEVLTVSRV